MDALTLTDLGAIIGAVMGPMLIFVTASMRFQHIENTKTRTLTRDLIEQSNRENRELIERTNKETRDLVERTNKETRELIERYNKETRELIERYNKENRELITKNRDLIEDTRQRCARIEGHLRIAPPPLEATAPPPEQTPEAPDVSDTEAA